MSSFKFWYEGEVMYKGCVMSSYYPPSRVEEIKRLELNSNDVIVATYPRTGTTWLCEIISMVADYERLGTKDRTTYGRIPFLDMVDAERPKSLTAIREIQARASPRYMRTHHPVKFFENQIFQNKTKMIAIIRNPRDTLVSLYNLCVANYTLSYKPRNPTWEEFFDEIVKTKRTQFGDWLDRTVEFWRMRHLPNVLLLTYEELKLDTAKGIRQVSDFLGKNLDDVAVREIEEAVHIDRFRNSRSAAQGQSMLRPGFKFVDKGEIGTWRSKFTPEQCRWVEENYDTELMKLGIKIPMYNCENSSKL